MYIIYNVQLYINYIQWGRVNLPTRKLQCCQKAHHYMTSVISKQTKEQIITMWKKTT